MNSKAVHTCSVCGKEWNTGTYRVKKPYICPVCADAIQKKRKEKLRRKLVKYGVMRNN